jgi:hypothetical protein
VDDAFSLRIFADVVSSTIASSSHSVRHRTDDAMASAQADTVIGDTVTSRSAPTRRFAFPRSRFSF